MSRPISNRSTRSESGSDRKKEPQADRGDLHTLTAATFTVLTGFTRSDPTGLGRSYLSGRHRVGSNRTGSRGAIRPERRLGPLREGRRLAAGAGCGACSRDLLERVLAIESVRDVIDARRASGAPLDRDQIETELRADARMGVDPGLRGSPQIAALARAQCLH